MSSVPDHVERVWASLKAQPISFAVIAVCIFGIGFAASRWGYLQTISVKDERINNLQDTIKFKDSQMADLNERLRILPVEGTAYSRLTNEELKQKIQATVLKLRTWFNPLMVEYRQQSTQRFYLMQGKHSQEEQDKIFHQNAELDDAFEQKSS